MRTDRQPLLLLAGLAALAVVLGLVTTGGPGTGRMERRDEARHADIGALQRHVLCRANAEGGQLPDDLTAVEGCFIDPDHLADPLTGAPYRYSVIDASQYEICAEFEGPPQPLYNRVGGSFDPRTGCYRLQYRKR